MPKPVPIDKETINHLYHVENLKLHEVAQRLGVCKDTIRKNMRRNGIPPKTPEVYRKGQDNRIIAMLPRAKELYYEKEFPFWRVCQDLGISFYALQRLFTDNGLRLRDASEVSKLAYRQHPQMGLKPLIGDKHPRYKGYRAYQGYNGYVRVYNPSHPRSGVNGYVLEHILAWEDAHKQPLPEGWTVHHLNGIKNDNRPVNLAGLPDRAHRGILAEKAKRIRILENRIKDLEKSLLEATRMRLD